MDDESTTTPAVEETDEAPVTEAAPESGAPATPPEGFIEQKRYEDLRSEFNRKQALWDRAVQGDQQAASELGLQFVDLLERQAQEQEKAILGEVQGHIDTLLKESKVELPQRLKQAILSEAWLRGGGPQIQPKTTEEVVKEWVDEYKQLEKAAGDKYIASKRAPHVSQGGTGATDEVLPLDASHMDSASPTWQSGSPSRRS
jgi:hypothetical protein